MLYAESNLWFLKYIQPMFNSINLFYEKYMRTYEVIPEFTEFGHTHA